MEKRIISVGVQGKRKENRRLLRLTIFITGNENSVRKWWRKKEPKKKTTKNRETNLAVYPHEKNSNYSRYQRFGKFVTQVFLRFQLTPGDIFWKYTSNDKSREQKRVRDGLCCGSWRRGIWSLVNSLQTYPWLCQYSRSPCTAIYRTLLPSSLPFPIFELICEIARWRRSSTVGAWRSRKPD